MLKDSINFCIKKKNQWFSSIRLYKNISSWWRYYITKRYQENCLTLLTSTIHCRQLSVLNLAPFTVSFFFYVFIRSVQHVYSSFSFSHHHHHLLGFCYTEWCRESTFVHIAMSIYLDIQSFAFFFFFIIRRNEMNICT